MPDELARRTVNLDASYQSFDDTTKEMQRCVMQDRLSARKLSPISLPPRCKGLCECRVRASRRATCAGIAGSCFAHLDSDGLQ
ncbi:hypothetical protein WJX77_008198 [Trebouxia sp. C0004]